jgi:FtsH-binding integral membrane protein
MAEIDHSRYAHAGTVAHTDAAVDEGLRAYMLRVYNYMAIGIALTGVVAYVLFTYTITGDPSAAARGATGQALGLRPGVFLTPLGYSLYVSPLKWVVMLAPLGFVFLLAGAVHRMSVGAAQLAFWAFAAVMGVSLSSIFLVFTGQSITQVFFVTAAAFGGLSLYGYTTKKDLSGWGSFLIMGVIGIVIAGLVNLFLQSSALQFAISVIGVLVFAGLTAYDTQRIKDGYYEVMNYSTAMAKGAIMGALSLYLDFINMFVMLLQLFGNRE